MSHSVEVSAQREREGGGTEGGRERESNPGAMQMRNEVLFCEILRFGDPSTIMK